MLIYYDLDRQIPVTSANIPTASLPQLRYKSVPTWELHFLSAGAAADLTGVAAMRAAVDIDFSSDTTPMCRTINADIDKSALATGVVSLPVDARATAFSERLAGASVKDAYFELWGYDASASPKQIFYACFKISARGVIDPDGGDAPEVPNGYITDSALSAALLNKADATHTHAQADVTGLTSALAAKAASTHTHVIAEVADLQTTLAGKAASTHAHEIADVNGLALMLEPLNELANVATSGSYNDLTDTPVVPADVSDLADASKKIMTKPGTWAAKTNNTTYTAATNGWLRFSYCPSYGQVGKLYIDSIIVAGGCSTADSTDDQYLYWIVPVFAGQTYQLSISSTATLLYFAPCS